MQKRFAAIQVTAHAAMSAASAFLAIVAYELGASLTEVGLIVAAYSGSLLLASTLAGRAADRYGRRRMVQLGLGLSTASALLHILAWDATSLGAARVAFGASTGLFPPALTSLAYDANRKLGRFTSWGSLGYSVGTLSAGLLAASGAFGGYATSVFAFASAAMGVAFVVSLYLTPRPEAKIEVPLFPRKVIARNFPAYLALLLRHVGATAVWSIFPLFLLAMGASIPMVAFFSFANGIAQFVAMQFADRYPSSHLVVSGLALSVATFVLFALSANLWMILATQAVLGFSWAALYTGALKFVMERNVERATSTGLLQSTLQLSNVLGPLLGGIVADAYGFRALMLAASALSLLAIPAFLYELRRHPSFLEELPVVDAHPVPTKESR